MPDALRLATTAVLLLVTAGCSRHPAGTSAAAAPVPGARYGVIAVMRPVGVSLPPVIDTADVRGSILRAIGPALGGPPSPVGTEMEFIVRVDGGETISVVQADAAGLHVGERVALTGGAPTRVARVLAAASGG